MLSHLTLPPVIIKLYPVLQTKQLFASVALAQLVILVFITQPE